MDKIKVLFICIHNSARSQMGEAFLKKLGSEAFEAHSAGLEPGQLNPLAIDVMKEVGIDISGNQTKSAFDLYKKAMQFSYVIAVCDEASAQKCPILPGVRKNIRWSIPDPSALKGAYDEKLEKTRVIRDTIKSKVKDFISEVTGGENVS